MVTNQYNACKRASETFNLIVDTREQQNSRYQQRMEDFQDLGVLPQRRALDVGDYSAVVHLPTMYDRICCTSHCLVQWRSVVWGDPADHSGSSVFTYGNSGW